MKKRVSLKDMGILHIMLAIYSFGSVLSKMAAKTDFMSTNFILLYICIVMVIGMYAIVWQQIIKKLPLTTAFANKAVTVIWGMIWGYLIFDEKMSINKLVGSLLVIAGIIIYAKSDKKEE